MSTTPPGVEPCGHDAWARRRTWALLGVAFLLITLAWWERVASSRQPNPLEGDAEEASAALGHLLAKASPARRTHILLTALDSPNPGLRYAAVDAIGDAKDASLLPAVRRGLEDWDSAVRQRALEVLVHLAPQEALGVLLAALVDDDAWIREASASQISILAGRPGSGVDRRAVPGLVRALGDDDAAVAVLSCGALRKLTGKPWRIRSLASPAERERIARKWRDWWRHASAAWHIPAGLASVPPILPSRMDAAPAFQMQNLDGQSVSLASQRGRVTLLNFWGSWCAPCQLEMPALGRLYQMYHPRGLDVVGIALSERNGAAGLRQWVREHHVPFQQCLADEATLAAFGHIHAVPVSVLIDGAGRIRYRWDGERDFGSFSAVVERVLRAHGGGSLRLTASSREAYNTRSR
ncbi:MAG: redoxin domain-containing protein [Chthonomonadales bacterium]